MIFKFNSIKTNYPIDINKQIKGYKIDEEFEILDYIKSGGSGDVYQGRFKKIKTSKYTALKFIFCKDIRENKNDKQESSPDFHEILLHHKLKHKNIPDIYGCYTIKEGYSISMQYCKYGDLGNFKKKVLKKQYLSETFICYISFQILSAILYLHKNKIIHFDIKQQNILVDEYLNFYLTDFSVSLDYKSIKQDIKLNQVGTSYYICPESLNEEKIKVLDTNKIDMYSFGVLIYLLAFGDYPYKLRNIKDKDYSQMAKNIKENKLDFPKNFKHSKKFHNFISKCLQKNNNERISIYDAMRDPWVIGSKYIYDEKEKLNNVSHFLIKMMSDSILEFNNYLN